MSRSPRIGLTSAQFPDVHLGRTFNGTSLAYAHGIARAGGVPTLLPTIPDLAETYARDLDAVLFTGGVDLHPSLYGGTARRGLGEVDPDRDAFELALYRAARTLGKPVFGICRGFQLINALEGGTLWQHLPDAEGVWSDHAQASRPPVLAHPVTFAPGSQLARAHADVTLVNSYHHQGVRDLAPTLTATAFAPDGLIEGVEGDGILAVQWHPELTFDRHPATFGTFTAFLASMGVTA